MFVCCICLDGSRSVKCFTTACGHKFHTGCIQSWCVSSVATEASGLVLCPICRSAIPRMPDERCEKLRMKRFVMGMQNSKLKKVCMDVLFLESPEAKEHAFWKVFDCFDDIRGLSAEDQVKLFRAFVFFQMQSFSRRGRGIY